MSPSSILLSAFAFLLASYASNPTQAILIDSSSGNNIVLLHCDYTMHSKELGDLQDEIDYTVDFSRKTLNGSKAEITDAKIEVHVHESNDFYDNYTDLSINRVSGSFFVDYYAVGKIERKRQDLYTYKGFCKKAQRSF